MAVFSGPEVVSDGLVMHLDAANPRSYPGSGTTWYDVSGNAENGTLINSPTYSAANSGIMTFDGVNDRFATATQIDLTGTNKISVDFFCRVLTYPQIGNSTAILFEVSADTNTSITGLFAAIGEDSSSVFRGAGVQYPISLNIKGNVGYNAHGYDKTLVNDLKWHHWCCIFDKSISSPTLVESRLFIDGVERSASVITSLANNNLNNFGNDFWYIGSRSNGSFPSNFSISDFKVYNKVLSQIEIQKNFNASRGRFGI